MATIHPIVPACKQIKGSKQKAKLMRIITLAERAICNDIYLNAQSRKELVKLGIPKKLLKLI